MLGFGIFSDTEARCFHLSFALFLAFACYPAFGLLAARPRAAAPIWRWPRRAIACVLYLVVFYRDARAAAGPADVRRHRSSPSSASCC